MSCSTRFLVILACFLMVIRAQAAFDGFLHIDGIPGESTDSGHADWIVIESFSQSLTREHGTTSVSGGSRFRGRAQLGDVVVTKRLDKASPKLAEAVCTGNRIPSAVLQLHQSLGSRVQFYALTFSNVVIQSCELAGRSTDSEPLPAETVSFSYGSIRWQYIEVDGTQSPVSTNVAERAAMPLGPDTDRDGIPDSYENANGLDPASDDSHDDKDGDGLSNYREYIAGTGANNRDSVFIVQGVQRGGASGNTVTWSAEPGRSYEVYVADSVEGPYRYYATVDATGSTASQEISLPGDRGFARIRVLGVL
jgi:type VI secretion system secreted protein Hcp